MQVDAVPISAMWLPPAPEPVLKAGGHNEPPPNCDVEYQTWRIPFGEAIRQEYPACQQLLDNLRGAINQCAVAQKPAPFELRRWHQIQQDRLLSLQARYLLIQSEWGIRLFEKLRAGGLA